MIRLWDIDDDREIAPRPGHVFAVQSVALSKDGRYILTGGADGTVRLWDLASDPPGIEVRSIEGPQGPVEVVLFSPDASRALSGNWEGDHGRVSLWDLATGNELYRQEGRIGGGIRFSPETNSPLATMLGDRFVALTDVVSQQEVRRFEYPASNIIRAVISPNARRVACGAEDRNVVIWDSGSSQRPAVLLQGSATREIRLAFSADGSRLVWGDVNGSVRALDIESPDSKPTPLAGHTKTVTCVAYPPDATMVAASAIDGRVIVWDAAKLKRLFEWQFPGAVHGVAFDEKSRHLATANGNGTVFILRLREP
jgi:WD40 repeat protein